MQRTTVIVAVVSGLLAVGASVPAHASGLDVRLGAFLPRAQSDLFQDAQELYGLEKKDWVGVAGGIEYNASLGRHVELGVGLDGYSRSNDTAYLRYEHNNGADIEQTTRLTVVPLSVSLKLIANPRRGAFTPYALVGVDAYFYDYESSGDFIDFQVASHPISFDDFKSTGVAPGMHVGAGLRVPIGDDLSITGEARYHFAKEVQMKDDFSANRLDVSGLAVTVGVNLRF